jgi:hypothetical protein
MIVEERYPNRMLPDRTWECGPKGGATIRFKPGRGVSLLLKGRPLESVWTSLAGRLGVIDENIKTLSTEKLPLYDRDGNRVSEFGARLDAIVNDLLWLGGGHSHVPNILKALREILSANYKEAKQQLSEFCRRIKAARALISNLPEPPKRRSHKFVLIRSDWKPDEYGELVNLAAKECRRRNRADHKWAFRKGPHESFFRELKNLAQELGEPPTKGQLGKALGLDASQLSRICRATGFDWLPIKKPGPTPCRWKRRR